MYPRCKNQDSQPSSPIDRQPFDLNITTTTGGVGIVHCSVHHFSFLGTLHIYRSTVTSPCCTTNKTYIISVFLVNLYYYVSVYYY